MNPPGWSNGKTRAFGAWYGGSTPPPGTDRRSLGRAAVQLELGCAPERDRIHEPAPIRGRDLDQADLVEVVVEAVGFGVEGDDLFTQ